MIEQKCKISDTEILQSELLTISQNSRKDVLLLEKIHENYLDKIDYVDFDLIDKLNADKMPVFTFEVFEIGENQSETEVFSDKKKKIHSSKNLIFQKQKIENKPNQINDYFSNFNVGSDAIKPTSEALKDLESEPITKITSEICEANKEEKNSVLNQSKSEKKTLKNDANDVFPTEDIEDSQNEESKNMKIKIENIEIMFQDLNKIDAKNEQEFHQQNDLIIEEGEAFEDDLDKEWKGIEVFDESKRLMCNREVFEENIIFLVHGLGGSQDDFKYLKSVLSFQFPKLTVFTVLKGVNNVKESIQDLGNQLGKEINRRLSLLNINEKTKIHFFGHSMGGLIIRSALPNLKDYLNNLVTFVSHNTPHLGAKMNNKAINMGANIYGKFFNSKSMMEMFGLDNQNFIESVCKVKEFSYFKNVVFIFNYDDGYVQTYSSRVVLNQMNNQASEKLLLNYFYENFKASNLVRIGISCPGIIAGFDRFIGRGAHMFFLSDHLSQMIVFEKIRDLIS